jgi:hypothetical protein
MVPDMSGSDIGEAEIEFLIATRWLAEADASDRKAVGRHRGPAQGERAAVR